MNTDNYGLTYFSESDKGQEITFSTTDSTKNKSKFYELTLLKDYIIKYSQKELNQEEAIKMLQLFKSSQSKINLTDLPISYYQEYSSIKGIIVPYYQNSISLQRIIENGIKNISNYYHHDNNPIHNLYLLTNEILDILEELQNNNIIYLDNNASNFIIKDNQIKLIDFEPQYLKYETNNKNIKRLLKSFDDLLYTIYSNLKLDDLVIHNSKDFKNMRKYLLKIENSMHKKR